MLDFHEGWKLYLSLKRDGYLPEDYSLDSGIDMEMKICELAEKHYGWQAKEPENEININDEYRELLEQQTPSDRLHWIYDIAIDYDGYRTYRGVASLLDEVIDCTQIKTKSIDAVLRELQIFNQYKSLNDFMSYQCANRPLPFHHAFPPEQWSSVEHWCNKNGYVGKFLGVNYDENGERLAISFKIDKKEDKDVLVETNKAEENA